MTVSNTVKIKLLSGSTEPQYSSRRHYINQAVHLVNNTLTGICVSWKWMYAIKEVTRLLCKILIIFLQQVIYYIDISIGKSSAYWMNTMHNFKINFPPFLTSDRFRKSSVFTQKPNIFNTPK